MSKPPFKVDMMVVWESLMLSFIIPVLSASDHLDKCQDRGDGWYKCTESGAAVGES